MNTTAIIELVVGSVLASTGLFTLIQFLITRHDKKNDDKQGINKRLVKLEKDSVRLQLLIMLKLMPTETQEIMTLAKYYFHTLKSNWYLTSLFYKWIREYNKGVKPEWFHTEE